LAEEFAPREAEEGGGEAEEEGVQQTDEGQDDEDVRYDPPSTINQSITIMALPLSTR
jgi:hypothetical protein